MKASQKSLLERVVCTIDERALFDESNACLLMVSGGSDSTALAYLMHDLAEQGRVGALAMLHVNHMLRGSDADTDAQFVQELADALGIPCFLCQVDIAQLVRESGENMEALARSERYQAANEALISMCQHEGFPFSEGRIAVAHNLDDRIENFYMRSIVGTGPGGFRSMRYRNGKVVRPLLDVTRSELREYLEQRAQSGTDVVRDAHGALWREDATNNHTDRFRAYVRHTIIPKAKEWNESLPATLRRTMNLIADEDDMLTEMAHECICSCVQLLSDEDGITEGFLILPTFGEVPRPLARRCVHTLLGDMLGSEVRIDAASVEAVLDAFDETGSPRGGYVVNIQYDLAVSANKKGVRVEPMEAFRRRRKRKA